MTTNISYRLDVRVADGPALSTAQIIPVEAYDAVDVLIADQDQDKEVQVQPGGAGQVEFLLLTASQYSTDITFKINNVNKNHNLTRPLLVAGSGGIGLLGANPPTILKFTNKTGHDITVQILVGRDATPP